MHAADLPLAALLALLASGCPNTGSSCNDWDGDVSETVAVPTEDVSSYDLSADGHLDDSECEQVCADLAFQHADYASFVGCAVTESESEVRVVCSYYEDCPGGRGHACIATPQPGRGASAVGAWLAQMAHNERASVRAFEWLEVELARHGAPDSLLARIATAADDERRHSAAMHALAASRGGEPPVPEYQRPTDRPLVAFAIENAVEGCVRETWGALEAHFQALHAGAVDIRDVMAVIATEESEHAQLSRDLHAWVMPLLSNDERLSVIEARAAALRALRDRLAKSVPRDLNTQAGLPTASQAQRLFAGLQAAGVFVAEA